MGVVKAVGFRLLAVLGTVLALLGIIELCCGGWFRADAGMRYLLVPANVYQVREHRLWGLEPNVIRYTRDGWGLRGDHTTSSDITILVVGGSTSDCRFVDDADAWPMAMQRHLRSGGWPETVGNAGVTGHSTHGHLESFRHWFTLIPGLKPKVVICYIGMNDAITPAGRRSDKFRRVDPTLSEYIQGHSAVMLGWRMARGTWTAGRAGVTDPRVDYDKLVWTDEPVNDDLGVVLRGPLEGYRHRVRELVALIRVMGAEPVLVTQPAGYWKLEDGKVVGADKGFDLLGGTVRGNGVDYGTVMMAYNDATLGVAQEVGCVGIDLARELPMIGGVDIYDGGHYTPAGCERIGVYLADRLRQEVFHGSLR